ncbi:hypothetical protein KS4_32630 [Poriferisphaera corsica]|uniref:Uncharacterized protein n=1 Tax=Poriferisphaera corsica TaxID=2528020 RepID=A0A517YY75_9BACT|nr:hypothetical protein KS4_32630 [Poriferisphaera corsica]
MCKAPAVRFFMRFVVWFRILRYEHKTKSKLVGCGIDGCEFGRMRAWPVIGLVR